MKRLYRKDQIASLAESIGIPIPKTINPRNEKDIRILAATHGYPVVLKLISSSSAHGVFVLNEKMLPEWASLYAARLAAGDFIAQECVGGSGFGVSMLFNHGRLRAKFTHKRLREVRSEGGMSTSRMGVVNPKLEGYAQELLESVEFHGVAMVEFRHDERTGKTWLLEVNPRFWGSLGLAIQSGVDFPFLLYRMAVDGDVQTVHEYQTGRVVNWLLGDLKARMGLWRCPSDSGKEYRPGAHGYDDFYWDDPLAFAAEALLSPWRFISRTRSANRFDLDIHQLECQDSANDHAPGTL